MSARLVIERLGAQGDGVAATARGPVHVAFALPGETVNAAVEGGRGTLMAVLEQSPQRVEPVCRHFGECGGCMLQHLEAVAYRAFKRERVAEAFSARGLAPEVEPLVPCPPGSRRRAALSALRTQGGIVLGYNRAHSNTIVDIAECPVLAPAIVAVLPALREVAGLLAAGDRPLRLTATATASGLDVAVDGVAPPAGPARRAAAALALEKGFARLTVSGDLVVEPRRPAVMAGDIAIEPPPGGFLQAVAGIEDAMASLAAGHLAPAKRIADLFAGSGAFALRLARGAEVHAVEGDRAALDALDRAFRHSAGLRRVSVERRDLFRRPLTARELSGFGGVLFDPPRAGAEDQARQIARSGVPLVVAVSCNPATLARDARILIDGGYRLVRVVPYDQFLWSAHVEAVALFDRPPARPSRAR